MINIRKLESELWESADLLRANSRLTSNEYCMPAWALFSFAMPTAGLYVEAEITKNRRFAQVVLCRWKRWIS